MQFKKTSVCLVLGLVWGCGDNADKESVETQGLHLTSTIEQSSDVAGIRFQFTAVDCGTGLPLAEPLTVMRPLEDFTIPGGISDLENQPLDSGSAHLFADAFQTLDAGCYDVTATPMQESGIPSKRCEAAWEKAVEVLEGQTTEIFLINQCHGKDPGAIDAIAALNHEPEIEDVSFEESKFVLCGAPQTVCATVSDPDQDPLEFVWELDPSAPSAGGPTVVKRTTDPDTGAVTECVQFEPSAPGTYPVKLTVYDQLWKDGSLMRIEDWLAAAGYPSESHAEFDFFFYVAAESSSLSRVTLSPKHAGHSSSADVLMLDSTILDGVNSPEAQAAVALGLTVDIVDPATWAAMSASDFGGYHAIVLGDRSCSSDFSAAEANALVWGGAVDGNVIVIGTDEVYHDSQGGRQLTDSAMAFVTADTSRTGALISMSCYYHSAAPFTPVPVLDGFGGFTATAVGSCYDDAHIVAMHPAMSGLTDATLSNWGCSVHNGFDTWPADFSVLAIAENSGTAYEAGDGTVGTPYILARGVIEAGCGNGTIGGAEQCDDGGNENGDGCDENCRLEICGNGITQSGEQCDDGNTDSGDGCSANCALELCRLD